MLKDNYKDRMTYSKDQSFQTQIQFGIIVIKSLHNSGNPIEAMCKIMIFLK